MSKASLETAIRNEILSLITSTLAEHYDTDVMAVSASELTIPVLDAEGNEKFALIKVSIPRGKRTDGTYTPYDGYAAADEWKFEVEDRQEKAKARQEKAERAEKEKERKRAAKATIRKLNTEGFKALVSKPVEDDA